MPLSRDADVITTHNLEHHHHSRIIIHHHHHHPRVIDIIPRTSSSFPLIVVSLQQLT